MIKCSSIFAQAQAHTQTCTHRHKIQRGGLECKVCRLEEGMKEKKRGNYLTCLRCLFWFQWGSFLISMTAAEGAGKRSSPLWCNSLPLLDFISACSLSPPLQNAENWFAARLHDLCWPIVNLSLFKPNSLSQTLSLWDWKPPMRRFAAENLIEDGVLFFLLLLFLLKFSNVWI